MSIPPNIVLQIRSVISTCFQLGLSTTIFIPFASISIHSSRSFIAFTSKDYPGHHNAKSKRPIQNFCVTHDHSFRIATVSINQLTQFNIISARSRQITDTQHQSRIPTQPKYKSYIRYSTPAARIASDIITTIEANHFRYQSKFSGYQPRSGF